MKLYHFLAAVACLLFMSSSTMKMPVCGSGEHELVNNASCDLKYYAAIVDISDPCGSHYTLSGTVTGSGGSVCIVPGTGEMVIKIAVIDNNNDQLWVGDTQCAGMQDDDAGTLCGVSSTMTWDSAILTTVN